MTIPARVEFYFDVSCPYAYLAHVRVEEVCDRHGAELVWKPILLGGLFRAVRGDDGPMTAMAPSKMRMNVLDLNRWSEHLGIPLVYPPANAQRSVVAMRAIVASGDIPRAAKALYRANWVEGLDLAQGSVVAAVLDRAGFDGAALVARTEDPAIKDELFARTREAEELGAFGVPTYIVRREGREPVFEFGQDRLEFVSKLLREAEPTRPRLSCFFDYSSPFAYLGATQVEAVAARHGAAVEWKPFLLGGLFRDIGTPDVPLFAMPQAKQRFMQIDMHRWAERHGVPLRFPSRFPMNTVSALRMTLQVPNETRGPLIHALFRALWVEDRDLTNPEELVRMADGVGLDGQALLAGAQRAEVKDLLRAATREARDLGVCGAPSFLVQTSVNREGTLFWGQDRFPLIERALAGWRPRGG